MGRGGMRRGSLLFGEGGCSKRFVRFIRRDRYEKEVEEIDSAGDFR